MQNCHRTARNGIMKRRPHLADELLLTQRSGPARSDWSAAITAYLQPPGQSTKSTRYTPDARSTAAKNAFLTTTAPKAYPTPAPASSPPAAALRANCSTVAASNNRAPRPAAAVTISTAEPQQIRAHWKIPCACPAAPFSSHACSSCTSPCMRRCRSVVSSSVGGIAARAATAGQYPVTAIPSRRLKNLPAAPTHPAARPCKPPAPFPIG